MNIFARPSPRVGGARRGTREHALAASLALTVFAQAAGATEKEYCVESHAASQQLRLDGRLREARDKLVSCSQSICPAIVRADCAPWLQDLDNALPSIVVNAHDLKGRQTSDVRVWVDQVLVAERLDGTAIVLDPGEHRITMALASGQSEEKTITLREGEKMRIVAVQFVDRSAPVSTTPRSTTGNRLLPPILAGMGALALGNSAFWGLKALSERNALSCKPHCTDDDVSTVRTELHVGTISLGAALVLGGVATWLFVADGSKPAPTTASAGPSFAMYDRSYAAENICAR